MRRRLLRFRGYPPLRGFKGWSRDHPTEPMKTLEMVPFSGTDLSREGRRGDGHIGQGWVLRFKASILNYLTPHLESNTDLQHHTQKRYNYAIDNDVSVHRQLKHKLNCFGYCTWRPCWRTSPFCHSPLDVIAKAWSFPILPVQSF
ncbi:hypothetical protein OUZ56_003097 [Daphnia magna]|uniref:Uncharacterized protein n=1 Tax=Daphnia magna TaxID=35525 RepID=A0ABR0A7R0_9CRUS|nr:hypothetical protein OUZ56_003097 [Daphnia magna]